LLAFQAVTFTIHKCSGTPDGPSPESHSPAAAYSASKSAAAGNNNGYGNDNRYSSNSSKYSNYNSNGTYGNGRGKESAQLFPFNPNTVSLDSLTLLGFSVKQAQTILRYREKGGRFRRMEEFAKIYTVSLQMYERLYPYITLPTTAHATNSTTINNNTSITTQSLHLGHSKNNPQSKQFSTGQDKQAGQTGQAQDGQTKQGGQSNQARQDGLAKQAGQTRPAGQRSGYQESWRVQVDLNEADSAALIEVKGIGPYFCKKILELRERLGSFASTSQLLEIRGMDEEKFERIKGQVFVHPSGIKRFKLTEADKRFLARHPYIGAYNARGIALFAEAMGKDSCTLSNLVRNNILSPEAAEKLKPYVIEP
ncbi:MAG: helix-hairpin-helix domain-containing protein, partial [Bacteroidales bacterium]|nr:helix-hairpin-helix domain-containing protein [Bacteroidales bacterium]